MLTIVNVPDPVLRKVSKPVTRIDKKVKSFIQDLASTLLNKTDPPGVGVSAIQVGKPLRMYFTYIPSDLSLPTKKWNKEDLKLTLYINPEITDASTKMTMGPNKKKPQLEGCLSIPKLWGPVQRHEWIQLTYQTLDVNNIPLLKNLDSLPKQTLKASGFPARVFQHEQDHLDGILFTDYTLKENLPLYIEMSDGLKQIDEPDKVATW